MYYGSVVPWIPETPCPDVFQYQTTSVPGDTSIIVTGLITIMKPSIETVLYLFVHLQLQAVLPTKYVGLVELINRNDTTTKSYRVRFPLVKPLPTVRFISLNYNVICSGHPVTGPVVTDIRLEHILKPLTRDTEETQETTPPVQAYNIDPGGECGMTVDANPLVAGGKPLQRGQWPWLVAIFVLKSLGLEFHCSGSIITRSFIVTVGHCMLDEEAKPKNPTDVVVYLGKFNLQHWEEPHSIIKEVDSIYIHPDFNLNKYTADIALLRLKTLIEYNIYIQPICLWSQSTELDLIVGRMGTVVGWGRGNEDDKMSPIPRALEIPIVSTRECIHSHSEFLFLTSSTTLCAGARDGKGPCNGDSGGGLMLPVIKNSIKRWHLRGLVSLSLLNVTTQSCDLSQYVLFTDTAKFKSWIAALVNR